MKPKGFMVMVDIDLASWLIFKDQGPASQPTNFLSPRTSELEEVANSQTGDYREYESN